MEKNVFNYRNKFLQDLCDQFITIWYCVLLFLVCFVVCFCLGGCFVLFFVCFFHLFVWFCFCFLLCFAFSRFYRFCLQRERVNIRPFLWTQPTNYHAFWALFPFFSLPYNPYHHQFLAFSHQEIISRWTRIFLLLSDTLSTLPSLWSVVCCQDRFAHWFHPCLAVLIHIVLVRVIITWSFSPLFS